MGDTSLLRPHDPGIGSTIAPVDQTIRSRSLAGAGLQSETAAIELTILMPCLNEAETLATCIGKAQNYLAASGIVGEVLIADNGSTDGSPEIARALGARVVAVQERGYGAALLHGLAAARGRYVIMGDADDSYDFSALQRFVEILREGADLVMGNRFRGGIEPGAMPFLHRYLGNPVLSFLGRLFFRIPVGDFHCGLRGFNRDRIRSLKLATTGMEFASEMVVRSALARFAIREVPTTLKKDGRSRPPHLRTWRDGWRHLKFLLMFSPRWLFLVPGGVLLALGLIGAAAVMTSPVQFGDVVLDLNTFFVACFACFIGTQLLTLGALTRQYAAVAGFLPWSAATRRFDRLLKTDRLPIIAAATMAVGLSVFASALVIWIGRGFGELSDPIIPRVVVAGLTLFVAGLQLLFAAFLGGVLNIPHVQR